ncbi:AzlC family ABC transporter permease [Salinactinospora qingdaonensis]|uniref:AzlC family ABC transporter permease n=1 Tax=Salinactinospora qingdaonensis TaxID=702744 RepID=A0ABP7FSX2_9ACTN
MTTTKQAREAVRLTAPVAMAYVPLGLAFGVLVVKSGIAWYWAPLSAVLIFAGSIEFLTVSLIAGGVPFVQVAATAFVVNFRHIFYGLTFPLERIRDRLAKIYGVWALTDETYAITSAGEGAALNGFQITVLQLVSHFWWAGAAFTGALVGSIIPGYIVGFGFALTAMFVTLLVDSLRNNPSAFQIAAALSSVLVAVIADAFFPNWFLISGLAAYLVLMTGRYFMTSTNRRKELV